MNESDDGLDFEGAEPEHLQPLLDALREQAPSTADEKEQRARQLRVLERLDAEIARKRELSVTTAATAATAVTAVTAATAAIIARAPSEPRVGDVGDVDDVGDVGDMGEWEDGATVRSPSFKERPAPPPPAEPPPLPVDAPEPRPPAVRPVQDLTITSVALDIPPEIRELMGRLPFLPRAPGPELARTMKVPVHNPRQGQTAPLGDDSIEKAEAVLPFVGNTVGAALVPFPRLSLEQYASLRAELWVWPERRVEILPRYHVMNAAVRRALEEHWHFEFVASPEARATFDQLLADYTAWLRTQR